MEYYFTFIFYTEQNGHQLLNSTSVEIKSTSSIKALKEAQTLLPDEDKQKKFKLQSIIIADGK